MASAGSNLDLGLGEEIEMSDEVIQVPSGFYSDELREILEKATEFDGYAAFGDDLGELANQAMKDWYESGVLPIDKNLIKACLFYEGRRRRFVGGYPDESDMPYLRALRGAINE